jgi:hypothetical protein
MENESADRSVIEGIVTPCNWDEGGRVTAVALSARDEEDYLIDSGGKGSQLIQLMHQQVRVTGVLQKNAEQKILLVLEYEIIARDELNEFEDGREELLR